MASKLLLTLLLSGAALAKTDIGDCESFDTVATPANGGSPYATRIWYVPDTGEVCELLDCGGGRAPPKTTVPGCDSYEGTETYSPRFIDPKTLGQAAKTDAETSADATVTAAPQTTSTSAPAADGDDGDGDGNGDETLSVPDNLETMPTIIATDDASEETTLVLAPSPTDSLLPTPAPSRSSGAETDAPASSTAPDSVTTGGAAVPTAGGMLVLAAGAAVYAGLM